MSSIYRVAKLTRSDKPLFVALMSKAFARDPLFLHVFGHSALDGNARRRVTAFVSFLFDKSFWLNEETWGCFENDNLLGAYVVEKPQASKVQKARDLWLLWGLIPLLIHLPGTTLRRLNSYMRITRSVAPSSSHHYLIMIGVEPQSQGKGVGTTLLSHLLNAAERDPESHGVALDTENHENVDLYRRFGFTLTEETQIDQLPVYCMFYPAQ
ncbi:GNAT family N-acetyltransferase [Paenibacillus sp. LHD-117]|uniref:GNAT family N-acetyltransferase n=1 Tax=Paenibacillus sp. LHD-117 TaxID=3071412 RepID=UPI0027E07431|nr:GNAT family N-acetyltransferase [Paenibacillus sp. LHD-117]MDQ6421961.1 GNAT family N-acetyltransferase [Paenibacillus sp. LHD-117]